MAILGLINTESYSDTRFKNIRRSVQYFYPNGAAPLTGILSLMDDDPTNDPEYSHWEQRMVSQRSVTITGGSSPGTGAFTASGGTDLGTTFSWTKDVLYRVYVADVTFFRVGHVVKINATISGIDKDLIGIVTEVGATYLIVRSNQLETTTSVPNTNAALSDEVLVIGSAFAEGIVQMSTEVYSTPTKVSNQTQIFRTPFSMTGTSVKVPLVYDETGPYKTKAKDHSIQHMIEIEMAMLFGVKHTYIASGSANATTGAGLPVRTTGGILWYLRQYEKQYSLYRGGNDVDAGPAAITADTDDEKRIIENTDGTITEKEYDGYLERVFRVTNNTSNEKLVLCGSGFLQTMNQLYRSKTNLTSDLPFTDTYGMSIVKHVCPFGTVYYKTHPLFSNNPTLRYCALFLDVKNLKYRPMVGRDTELLKMRQPNNADYREDEYLTEAGVEVWFPESCMFLKNVRDYTL